MNRFLYFLITFAAWMLLTWSLDIENIVVGGIIALLCTVLLGHIFFENVKRIFDPV